jgi:hypothetical protein
LGTEVLPLHILLGADLRPGSPAPAIGPGQASFGVSEKIPEVLGGTEIGYLVVTIDIPHELTEEVTDGHLAEGEGREAIPQIDFDGLAEHLLVSQIVPAYNLGALIEDLSGDFDVLEVEGQAGL